MALEDIRVLDLTVYQQGPFASTLLADMGADVIKIEAPDTGDLGRLSGDAYFGYLNRNKRAITIDLKNEAGRETFLQLVERADIFHNNLRPGVLKRLNLTYPVVSARNPRIIMSNATGWGHLGPDAEQELGSFDGLAQARGGLFSINGTVESGPHPVPHPLADQFGAVIAAYGMLAALVERNRSGQGQEINTSLYGSQLCMQGFGITGALWRQRNSQLRPANSSPRLATYECSDGLLTLAGGAPDRWWPAFCEVMGVAECAEGVYTENATDPDWCKRTYDRLNQVFGTADRETWMRRLSPRFHVQPVRTYLEIGQDQQAWDNGYLVNVTNRAGETVPMVGLPVHLSRTPASVRSIAPEMGQHTDEVLGEFGFTPEEIAGLRAAGAFGREPAVRGSE